MQLDTKEITELLVDIALELNPDFARSMTFQHHVSKTISIYRKSKDKQQDPHNKSGAQGKYKYMHMERHTLLIDVNCAEV